MALRPGCRAYGGKRMEKQAPPVPPLAALM